MGKKAYMKQAAQELGLTEYQLRRMAKEGNIPFLKSGVKYIFDVEQCEEYLRNKALENIAPEEPVKAYGSLRRIDCK